MYSTNVYNLLSLSHLNTSHCLSPSFTCAGNLFFIRIIIALYEHTKGIVLVASRLHLCYLCFVYCVSFSLHLLFDCAVLIFVFNFFSSKKKLFPFCDTQVIHSLFNCSLKIPVMIQTEDGLKTKKKIDQYIFTFSISLFLSNTVSVCVYARRKYYKKYMLYIPTK